MSGRLSTSGSRFSVLASLAWLLVGLVVTPASAQASPCSLLAPPELAQVMPAAFGAGVETDDGCAWETETRDGHRLAVRLDVAAEPATVEIDTDDPSIDASAAAAALSDIVAERLATGQAAPTSPPLGGGTDRPDLCEILSVEDVGTLLDAALIGHGEGATCAWRSDEAGRVLVGALISFEDRTFDDVIDAWPDAESTDIFGLPTLAYGWDAGLAVERHLSVDLGDGLLTAQATSDLPEIDAGSVARQLVERTLAEMGLGE